MHETVSFQTNHIKNGSNCSILYLQSDTGGIYNISISYRSGGVLEMIRANSLPVSSLHSSHNPNNWVKNNAGDCIIYSPGKGLLSEGYLKFQRIKVTLIAYHQCHSTTFPLAAYIFKLWYGKYLIFEPIGKRVGVMYVDGNAKLRPNAILPQTTFLQQH